MSRFLRFVCILTGIIFVGNAFAAGYVCEDLRTYTSCSTGYYLKYGKCLVCPDQATYCPGLTQSPLYKITLNHNGGTASYDAIYASASNGWYFGTSASSAGTSISKLTSLPVRAGCKFNGYYTTNTNERVAITNTGTFRFAAADFTAPTTFKAHWTCMEKTVTNPTKTYDGTPLSCNGIKITSPETGVTIKYGTKSGTYDMDTPPSQTTVGKTVVYYHASADEYTPGTGSFTCEVTKAQNPIKLSVEQGTVAYQASTTFTISDAQGTVNAISNDTNIAIVSIDGTTVTVMGVKPGTTTITVTADGDANYNAGNKTYNVTVTKADQEIIPQGWKSGDSGTTVFPFAKTLSLVSTSCKTGLPIAESSDTDVATVFVASRTSVNLVPVATGTTDITLKCNGNEYYNESPVATYSLTVTPGTINATASDDVKIYDGTALTCDGNINVTAPNAGYTIKYGTSNNSYTMTSAPSITNVKDSKTIYYQITATNFEPKTGSFKCTVNKAENPITLSASSVQMQYNSSESFTVNNAQGTLSATSANTNVATVTVSGTTVTIKSGASYGTSDITVTAAGNDNYKAGSKTYTATVNKGIITLNAGNGAAVGTKQIYQTYNTGVYLATWGNSPMSSNANKITIPTKDGFTFTGYYKSTSDTEPYILATGYITDAGLSAAKSATSDITWYAKWTSNQYTISYDCNGGNMIAPVTPSHNVGYGAQFTTYPANTCKRTGYNFTGWDGQYSEAGHEYTYETIGNTTLKAQWELKTISCEAGTYLPRVSEVCAPCPTGYYCPAGSHVYDHTNNQGTIGCPPSYEDSEAGAKSSKDCYAERAIEVGTVPTNCKTATWKSCSYKDYYETEETETCTPEVVEPVSALAGAYVNTDGVSCNICAGNTYQTKNGYGASSCTSCASGYSINGATLSDHDQQSDCIRIITLNKNGGTGSINTSVTCSEGVACNFGNADLVQTGYTFTGGWGTSESCASANKSFTTPTTSTYYACKTANKHTISFDANGGNGGQNTTVTATFDKDMPSITTSQPTRAGYVFMGWFDAKTGGVQYYTNAGQSVRKWNKDADTVLYAQWSLGGPYSVEFKPNGGTSVSNTECDAESSDIALPLTTRDGYTFDGWYNDATKEKMSVITSGTCTDTMSFTAHWTQCDTCAHDSSVSTCNIVVENNVCVAKPTCASGYKSPTCNGLTCACAPETYTVKYDCGVGSGNAPADATATYKELFTPVANTCTAPAGERFSHWDDGTKIRVVGTSFEWTYASGKTLTAVYETSDKETVSYVLGGGTIQDYNGAEMACNKDTPTFTLPTDVVRAGYEFAGWKNASGTIVTTVEQGTCTSALTFTAQWVQCNSTVDGACNCAMGTYPLNGTCTSCVTSCSTLGTGYQGTYNICAADANQQCYKTCETSCVKPSKCPTNFSKCAYITNTIVSGKAYYGSDSVCTPDEDDSSYCPINYDDENGTYCSSRYYMHPETLTCVPCNGLEGNYTQSYLPTKSKGATACYAMVSSSGAICNYSDAFVLDSSTNTIIGTKNYCPEYATCTEGPQPTSCIAWYPSEYCVSQSYCTMTFACDAGYTANTSSSVNYGIKRGRYESKFSMATDVAVCNPNLYYVVFDDNYFGGSNGTMSQVFTYAVPQPLSQNTFTRVGYKFTGWNTKEDGSGQSYQDQQEVNNLTTVAGGAYDLFAQWKPIQYDISYYNLDGAKQNTQNKYEYTIEDTPVALYDPTKHGYDFEGWYDDASLTTKVTQIPQDSIGNKEFWANWVPVEYTITYNLDGGQNASGNPTKYTIEDASITLGKPTKTGYTFSKWIDEAGNTVNRIATDAARNIVLTAIWTSDSYIITYDLAGGINNSKNPETYSISDTPIELAAPSKTGYVFDKWTGVSVQNNSIIAGSTGDTTVVASWTPTTFTVRFDPTDATGADIPNVTCVYDQDCTAADAITAQNKEFSAWNTEPNGSGQSFAAGGNIRNLVSDGGEVTLYAIWNQVMVACEPGFYYNNGVKTSCTRGQYCPGNGNINAGSSGCIETCPSGGATVVDGADSVSQCRKIMINGGDMTFTYGTAKWDCAYREKENAYRDDCQALVLTCDAGYYYAGDGKPTCIPVKDGYYSPAPVTASGEKDDASLIAYKCTGETGDNDGIGSDSPRANITNCYAICALTTNGVANSTAVTPDTEKSFSTENGKYPACSYTIRCQTGYTAQNGVEPKCIANTYKVTFDKNQGTGDMVSYAECTFNSGKCNIPATSGLSREGYVPAGKWCSNANGTGNCYVAGASTDANISVNGTDTKLYAIWEPDVFKIDLLANDATEKGTQDPVYLKYTIGWFDDQGATRSITSIDTTALPSKPGYNFAGYSVNGETIVNKFGVLLNTTAALKVTTKDTAANVMWSEGNTICEPGYYYAGSGGECVPCTENHWCPGGTFPTGTGVIGGLEVCPDNGMSTGGKEATNPGVCYKHDLDYVSVTGSASGTQTCNYNVNTSAYDYSCRNHAVMACVAGYYYVSGIDCVQVGANYYSPLGNLERESCPDNGLTGTLKTAASADECYKTVEYVATYGHGTQVCNFTSTNDDGGARYATNCRDKYITHCQGGYYRENELATDCVQVGFNAYSEENSLSRVPCPDGGETNIENAPASTACFKSRNPFESEHGTGVRHCTYEPQTSAYTFCDKKIFETCAPGYYWAAYGDEDCSMVGYGFFGPVADAGNQGMPTARQACEPFNGQQGYTDTETSADATACYMTNMPCTVNHGSGVKTCEYSTSAQDYSANCNACQVNYCDEKYYINDNQCNICPAGSICDEQTRIGDAGVANAQPKLCSTMFNGRYPESDEGSFDATQCFGTCDKFDNVTIMSGRDYQGANMTDTCTIQQCNPTYYLTQDKSQCQICPANSICDIASGSDMNLDGVPDSTPKTCDALTNGTHTLSEMGSTKIEQCYATCSDYEILGGMAIRDFDTVYYDDVCTYKGLSDTGNPCEIKSVNGKEACIEKSCNSDYELIDGHCQKCLREHAKEYKPNGNCLVALCDAGFHPEADQCADNTQSCNLPNAEQAVRKWDEDDAAFGICKVIKCMDNHHIEANACVPDIETCKLEHGIGTRAWDPDRETWGECFATSCEPGYTNDPFESDEPEKQCGRCSNAKSSLNQIAVSSYANGCTIAACMYQGELYNLENNECVPICPMDKYEDETGTMRWNPNTKKCERNCFDGYISW